MKERGFVGTGEVAERFGLTVERIGQLIDEGKIDARRFGDRGHWRIRVEEVERLVRQAEGWRGDA